MSKTGRALKVITYGSGPASELVRTYSTDSVQSLTHVGRQSLISAMTGLTLGIVPAGEATQLRMERVVKDDIQATLPKRIREHAESADLLIWDIHDERFGIATGADSTYVTRSPQLKTASLKLPDDSLVIPFGTDQHFDLWQRSSSEFVFLLEELGILESTVLLDVPWACMDEFGEDVALPYGMSPSEANTHFERYYSHIKDLGVQVLSERHVVSAAEHRLGRAPFNYLDSTYHSLSGRLHHLLAKRGRSNGRPAWNWDERHQSEIKTWTSIGQADFRQKGRTEHLIRPLAAKNQSFPARFLVENKGSDVLLVISHGALPRAKYTVPRFEWLATLSARDESRIFLSDTALEEHADLELSWFTGNASDDLTARYAEVVSEAAKQMGATRIVFMGGSGGGFASLSLAAKVPGSRALVFNPQTVIRNYWNNSVDKFQTTLFPEMKDRSGLTSLGSRVDATRLPQPEAHQIIYVQNDDDTLHVEKHLTPFALRNRIPVRTGVSENGNLSLILEHFASGHNMPYRDVLLDFVELAVSGWGEPLTAWHELPASPLTRAYRQPSCPQTNHGL